ncbi:hypothetical protein A20C1_08088 [marine actinobacterium PHSC20C1]|nr:hypothetical protein A20C1_08088 [marine actinobacterium PHSC20C1]
MRNKRISDRVAQAILSGRAPESRPDLTSLANSIAEFREAAYESTARPSEELMVRLGLTETPSGSSHHESLPTIGASKRGRTMFSWIAGLGIASKIALGATVAVAATAGAGAGGILPVGAQDAFDTVISTVVTETEDGDESTEDTTTTPESEPADEVEETEEAEATEHPDNFGGWVSERAKDPDKVGRTFGAETSEAAHEKNKKSESESPSIDHDESEEADDTSDDSGNSGSHGKSENKQGGKSKP